MDNRIKNSNYYNNLTNLDNLNMILNFNNEFTTRKNIYIKDKIFDDFNKNNQRNSYNSDFDKLQNDINDLNNKLTIFQNIIFIKILIKLKFFIDIIQYI